MLPIVLSETEVAKIIARAQQPEGYNMTVDLERQTIEDNSGSVIKFSVPEFQRYCLLEGLDDIGLTLRHEADIRAYEAAKAYPQITQTGAGAAGRSSKPRQEQ
jgi:3-isopropylmalate/(R)-2-methylmalate dehydratase small subunit